MYKYTFTSTYMRNIYACVHNIYTYIHNIYTYIQCTCIYINIYFDYIILCHITCNALHIPILNKQFEQFQIKIKHETQRKECKVMEGEMNTTQDCVMK